MYSTRLDLIHLSHDFINIGRNLIILCRMFYFASRAQKRQESAICRQAPNPLLTFFISYESLHGLLYFIPSLTVTRFHALIMIIRVATIPQLIC